MEAGYLKAVDCKWVFKQKYNEKGESVRYKARLTAKGYTQKYGFDYEETYLSLNKILLGLSCRLQALITGKSNREISRQRSFWAHLKKSYIYMKQPEEYTQKGKEELVCKLNKSLYGLKQSSRVWNHEHSSEKHWLDG